MTIPVHDPNGNRKNFCHPPMKEVLVIGHKNPDTDSVCSAFAYAALKESLDPTHRYVAARCGSLNKQTRYIFEKFGITPPKFVKDIYPKVEDVMTQGVAKVRPETPLMQVMQAAESLKVRSTPVVDKQNKLLGMITLLDLTHFFLSGATEEKPTYQIRPDNLDQVLRGKRIQAGEAQEFTGTLIAGAMSAERFEERLQEMETQTCVLVVGNRPDLIGIAIAKQIPVMILTGADSKELAEHLEGYKGWVYLSEDDTADTLRRVALAVPASALMSEAPSLSRTDTLEQAQEKMDQGGLKSLAVVDGQGRLEGILAKSDLVKKEPKFLILMDHNEMSQAVDGAEGAEIVEIVDHHRLGTIKTKNPVHFFAKPVGSTCTLVYQQYKINGQPLNKATASLLLCGVLTDTVILKSPTATVDDKRAIDELAALAGLDYQSLGIELFSVTDALKARSPLEVINTDFKVFKEYGFEVGIGQVEVVTIEDLPDAEGPLKTELEKIRVEKGLGLTMLLVTDIINENSVLLCTEQAGFEKGLRYKKLGPGKFDLPSVLSRKKQLLPEVLRVLEELAG